MKGGWGRGASEMNFIQYPLEKPFILPQTPTGLMSMAYHFVSERRLDQVIACILLMIT